MNKLFKIIGLCFFLTTGLHAYESRESHQSRQMPQSRSVAPQQVMHSSPRTFPARMGARPVATQQNFHQHANNSRNFQAQANHPNWNNNHARQRQNYNYYSSPFGEFYAVAGIPDYSASTVYYSNDADSYANTSASETNNTNAAPTDNQLPSGEWVAASNGNLPNNAIVYQNQNGNTGYYCRATYNNQLYYGELEPNEACYAQDQSTTLRFNDYEVLVNLPN